MASVTSRIEINDQATPVRAGVRNILVAGQPCSSKVSVLSLVPTLYVYRRLEATHPRKVVAVNRHVCLGASSLVISHLILDFVTYIPAPLTYLMSFLVATSLSYGGLYLSRYDKETYKKLTVVGTE